MAWQSCTLRYETDIGSSTGRSVIHTKPTKDRQDCPPDTSPVVTEPPQKPDPGKVAVFVETRLSHSTAPLILHFMTVLGPSWSIHIFTTDRSWLEGNLPVSAPFQQAIEARRIVLRPLPPDTEFQTHGSVSQFLVQPWLWEQLQPAKHALLFQSDSIICSNSPFTVDDFLDYDFVGAPISPAYGAGYNGGLSLRNVDLTLDIARTASTESMKFEDQWFYARMKERGANLPPEDVARLFAVETVYYDYPLGYHQPQRWNRERMGAVTAWCPEVALAQPGHFYPS